MRPRVWLLVVVAVVFASAAARSCAEFMRYGPYRAGEPYAWLFLGCALAAGPPLVLASYRLWRRPHRDAWPASALCVRITVAGVAVTIVSGASVLWMALYAPLRWRSEPVGNTLVAVSAIGFVVSVGALALLVISAIIESRRRSMAA